MSAFFKNLFGNRSREQKEGLKKASHRQDRKSGRREPPVELYWSKAEYVPLPPSPPTWEVDGRDEFHREYNDPTIGPVFDAAFRQQHTKVIRLSKDLTPEQKKGRVGDEVSKAYRKQVIQRMKAEQLVAAAKLSIELFEQVPDWIQGVDQRRFNRILNQLDKKGKKHSFVPVDAPSDSVLPLFELSEGTDWELCNERKLDPEERPDSSFDIVGISESGVWLIDRSANKSRQDNVKCRLRRLDSKGQLIAKKELSHNAYRTGNGAFGLNLAIMDSEGTLHIYDSDLSKIVESNLSEDPRIVDHFRTTETNYWGDFKSQVRAVDVSADGVRYLFTLADEAWCCTIAGEAVWGVMMPLNEGWKRVVGRSEKFGVGHEIEDALRLFKLNLPVSPKEIKKKYHELALAHHPDLHPDDPHANDKMKTFNSAFEILTGVDPSTLSFEESEITSFKRSSPDQVIEAHGIRIELTVSGGVPQDWVYAASFSSNDGNTYVATYSGKVILLSSSGTPLVVYDIGTCPSEIIDSGDYTYFLTPTRLYVVENRTHLTAFLDVFRQGKLLVTSNGFGLLTSKRLQWFSPSGTKLGEVSAKDPIRRIFAAEDGTIIQTRQHGIEIQGMHLL